MKLPSIARFAAAAFTLLWSWAHADVWVADRAALYKIDSANPHVVLSVPATKTVALAVDGRDGAFWTLSDSSLIKRTSSGSQSVVVDLNSIDMPGAVALGIDGRDGSVWVGEGGGSVTAQNKSIVRLDQDGTVLIRLASPGGITGLAVALDQSLWVLGKTRLYHYTGAGTLLASIDLQPLVSGEPKLLKVDSISAWLLVAGERRLLRVDAHSPASSNVLSPLPSSADAIAVDEADGSFYVLAAGFVYVVGASGTPSAGIDLAALGVSGPTTIAFDPASQSLFVGGTAGIARLTRQVTSPVAVALPNAVQAIGVSPLALRSSLSLLSPMAGSVTNAAMPPFNLKIEVACSGNPCGFSSSYYQTYAITATLNGQSVGSSFAPTSQAGVFSFTPATRLPEGTNTFTASARDSSGQTTPDLSASFVIDTTPPTFVSLAPVSPSFTNQTSITVSGRLSEPSTLRFGSQGIPVAADGTFSFPQSLIEGVNSIDLVANDLAGNSATASLNITRDTVPPSFANIAPANGMTVSNPGVVITGTVSEFAAVTISRGGQQLGSIQGQSFSFPVTLNAGSNAFVLVATDRAGNQTSQPLSLTLGSSIQLSITSPTAGGTVNGSRVLVSGTFAADQPVGITVNGLPATVVGNQFSLQAVLSAGLNTLTVLATAVTGATTSATVNVISVASPEVIFDPPTGIGPLQVTAELPSGYFVAVDFDGDGVYEQFVFGGGGRITFKYQRPGTYMARVLMADNFNNTYNLTVPIVVYDVHDVDQAVRATYNRMTERMRAGDVEGALQCFTLDAAAQYRPAFQELSDRLPQVADQLGTIVDGQLSNNLAEYLISRDTPTGRRGFLIYLIRGGDGLWRLAQF